MADKKELITLALKAGIATAPFCGGVAEIFGWITEGRFVSRRLGEIESLLGDKTDMFLSELKELNEHEYYAIRKLLKFHCFESFPELTPITAKAIINYVLNKSQRIGDDQIIEILCQLNASDILALQIIKRFVVEKREDNYSEVIEWSDVCPLKSKDNEGKTKGTRLSSMVLTTLVDEDDTPYIEASASINSLAISFSKLNHLKVISAFYSIYSGMNTDFDIDQFTITPFGVKILDYIDIDNSGISFLKFGNINIKYGDA